MINIFRKSRPKLSSLIPNGFVDIHSHTLPYLDDGSKTMNQTKEMVQKMKDLGFSKIICTPHSYPGLYDNTTDSIKKSFESVKKNLRHDIELDYASEYFLDHHVIEKAEKKTLLTIKKNYVLVEMSFIYPPNNLYEILFQLKINDYKIILAHPERYRFYFNSFKEFHKLKDFGCHFQLNLCSLTGYYGNDVAKFANKLVNENLYDFSGSDFHSLREIQEFNKAVKITNLDKLETLLNKNSEFN
tara:strand:- start:4446 stop:5174 length:729 start_codon:yes stop_codon:yes gene_type:complete